MAELLAIGTTAATSSDFTLSGDTASLLLTGTPALLAGSQVEIQAKTSGGVYIGIGQLTPSNPLQVLSAPGVFRVSRPVGVSCGVDKS